MLLQNHGWTLSQYASRSGSPQIFLYAYVRFIDHLTMIQVLLNEVNNATAALYERESPQIDLIIAGDFNVPNIIWSERFGQAKSSPSYGTAVNNSLLDLASDYHLE